MALTKVLDKLVQVGPGYLDQTLRTYITDNRHVKFYTDTVNNKSYAVFAFYSSGSMVLKEEKKADLLIVGGGGGSSIGNLSGGSGAGAVVMVENAMLPAEEFTIGVGAGGAGATVALWAEQYSSGDGLGSVGGDSYFEVTLGSANTIIAKGGGVGGYKRVETMGLPGGSGGGSGGAERDPAGALVNVSISPTPTGSGVDYGDGLPAIVDATVTAAIANKYFTGNVYSYGNEGGWADPWYYDPAYVASAGGNATYHPGGGGGAGVAGGSGDDTKGGDGGDGVTIPWVNEVFREAFHFNGDIYWGGGGGGSSASDEEPGNGGLGGGGGGASVRNSGDINTAEKLYYNGHGGIRGINTGYDADNLLGGAGGQNTGGGAGGSTNLTTGTYGLIENTQGNHGGSGFVLIRVHLDDAFNPFSASLG